MSRDAAPPSGSRSLVDVAADNPGLSIPLFAGAGALIFAAGIGRRLVSSLLAHGSLPKKGVLLLAFFAFHTCVLLACVALLHRNGWAGNVARARGMLRELAPADRIVVALIALLLFALLYAAVIL